MNEPGRGAQAPGELAPGEGIPRESGGGAQALDEETASRAVLTVLRLFRALERVDTGLTPQQYRILKLAGAGGERSARLAERLAVAKPTLTATADGLVAAGYAQREAEPGDRRVVRLCLTTAGHAALDHADAAYARWLGPLLGATGDRSEMLQALQALDAAMDERRRARLAELSVRGAPTAAGEPSAHRDPNAGDQPSAGIDHAAGEYLPRAVSAGKTVRAPSAARRATRATGAGPA